MMLAGVAEQSHGAYLGRKLLGMPRKDEAVHIKVERESIEASGSVSITFNTVAESRCSNLPNVMMKLAQLSAVLNIDGVVIPETFRKVFSGPLLVFDTGLIRFE
jgi:hypothetical protein